MRINLNDVRNMTLCAIVKPLRRVLGTGYPAKARDGLSERRSFHKASVICSVIFIFALIHVFHGSDIFWGDDSIDYVGTSLLPLTSLRFWSNRPFAIPLLYKIFGGGPFGIAVFQIAVHGFSWLFLTWVLVRSIASKGLALLAAMIFLLLGLSREVCYWDVAILSESLTNSLLVLLFAETLNESRLYREGRGHNHARLSLFLLAFTCVLWAFSRPQNGYATAVLAILALAVPLAPGLSPKVSWRRAAGAAVFFTAILASYVLLQAYSVRRPWRYPLKTIICDRILPDAELREFFVAHGMPSSGTVYSFIGKHNAYSKMVMDSGAPDSEFDEWVNKKGVQAYLAAILSHPSKALGWIWKDRGALVNPRLIYTPKPYYLVMDAANGRHFIPELSSSGYRAAATPVSALASSLAFMSFGQVHFIVLAITMAVIFWLPHARAYAYLFTFGIMVWVAMTVVANLGDSIEPDRHALTAALLLRLVFWGAAFMAVDGLILKCRRAESPPINTGVTDKAGQLAKL
jgi:hypothetical protein